VSTTVSPSANAQGPQPEQGIRMEFGVSEPCGLLHFMDSIAEERDEGPALSSFFQSQRKLDASDLGLIQRYKALSSAPGSQAEFISEAGRKRSLQKMLTRAACEHNEFDEFLAQAKEYCAPSYFDELKVVLLHFRPLYDEQIWRPCDPVLRRDVEWFKSNERSYARPLNKIHHLFESSLGTEQALKAVLIPVPYMVVHKDNKLRIRSDGANSEAMEPRFGVVSMNILAPETAAKYNDEWLNSQVSELNKCTLEGNSVMFHEFIHLVWAYRKPELKEPLFASFKRNDMKFNYDLLNEAQACALTAWFCKNIGKENEGGGYDNEYVVKYAVALRPVLEEYIGSNRSLDADYAIRAMKVFKETFPDWIQDPQVVLWSSQIVAEQDPAQLERDLAGHIFKFGSGDHQMRAIKGQSWDQKKTEFSANPEVNTIFFIQPNQLDLLAKNFEVPERVVKTLKEMTSRTGASSVLAATKLEKRWLIFCIADTLKEQEGELEALAKSTKMMPIIQAAETGH
jgi:hypothetical protein